MFEFDTGYRLKATVGLICAFIGGAFCSALGGWDVFLRVLVFMAIADYVSGLIAAFIEKALNIDVGLKGVAKKVLIFVVVAVAFNIDQALGTDIIRLATISFYVGIEGLSVVKNASRAGLPLPAVLVSALEELNKKNREVKSDGTS